MTKDQNIELVTAMREILRRAVITLAVLRDPDKRFLGLSQMPQHIVHDVKEAYGYSSVSVREFQPTALEITQMEIVLPWLAWLRRDHGDLEARRFIGWAMGVPTWRLAKRENCSDRTVMNRIDRSVSLMIERFAGAHIAVEVIEEPYKSTPYALVFERPSSIGDPVKISKVYIGGIGFMKGGKRLRTAAETVDQNYLS
jgi:hypothetical protein